MRHDWIQPRWPAPANVHALSTTRSGGFSRGPWKSLNLGFNCGDDPAIVSKNRESLCEVLPNPPFWLKQVHGHTVARHPGRQEPEIKADAVVSFSPGRVCAVLTADCLPVIFCSRAGDRVAVAHAGWRGLASGVLQSTVSELGGDPEDVMAWLGPAIGPQSYEVGSDVSERFPGEFPQGFTKRDGLWLMDLYCLARLKLEAAGVRSVYGGGYCTMDEPARFFSFRRDGVTGRMASLVWMEK